MKKIIVLLGLFVSVLYGDYVLLPKHNGHHQRKKWSSYPWKRPSGMGMKGSSIK
ncbi:hypothetical protein HOM50_03940 [bacterium]|nr:hypothetical protein [bacterium]MBT5015530.1 hypothetical protein [bacterium]